MYSCDLLISSLASFQLFLIAFTIFCISFSFLSYFKHQKNHQQSFYLTTPIVAFVILYIYCNESLRLRVQRYDNLQYPTTIRAISGWKRLFLLTFINALDTNQ